MSSTGDTRALLTIQEAANVLCVSVSTLRRWDRDGTLLAFRPTPKSRLVRYRPDDLHAFTQRDSVTA